MLCRGDFLSGFVCGFRDSVFCGRRKNPIAEKTIPSAFFFGVADYRRAHVFYADRFGSCRDFARNADTRGALFFGSAAYVRRGGGHGDARAFHPLHIHRIDIAGADAGIFGKFL